MTRRSESEDIRRALQRESQKRNGAVESAQNEIPVPISPKPRPKAPLFVAGGQGRDGNEVNRSAWFWGILLIIAGAVAIIQVFVSK